MAHYRLISFYHNFNAFFFTINPTLFRFYSDNFSRIIYNSINANDLKEKDYGEERGGGKKGKKNGKKIPLHVNFETPRTTSQSTEVVAKIHQTRFPVHCTNVLISLYARNLLSFFLFFLFVFLCYYYYFFYQPMTAIRRLCWERAWQEKRNKKARYYFAWMMSLFFFFLSAP